MSADHEAKSYRLRLRDTEAERDRLAATLTALQRGRVEAIATQQGITAEALWAAGTELDSLLGEDGQPDPIAVAAAADAARQELGIDPTPPPRRSAAGLRSGAMNPPPPADHWRDAFAPKG